jgi:hypothetical protein
MAIGKRLRRWSLFFALGLLQFVLAGRAPALGEVRVAGYTSNDQQVYGPALERIAYEPLDGVHIVWKDAGGNPTYNFLDLLDESWRWPAGVRVLDRRLALGNLALSPADRRVSIACSWFTGGLHHAGFAWDTLTGSGGFVFDEYESPDDLTANLMAITGTGARHLVQLRHDTISYTRGGSATRLGRAGTFSTHNVAASRLNNTLSIFWTMSDAPNPGTLCIRRSTNTGYTWRAAVNASDSIPGPAYHTFLGAYGTYDEQTRLHVLSNVYDGTNPYASAIWHYCENDTPNWSLIARSSAASPAGTLPGQALIAGRPSIGLDPTGGDLFAVWEQFDSANVEPATGVLRADIWASWSSNDGSSWGQPVRLTEPDGTSKRYPCIARRVDENLHIEYLVDSIAGFAAQGQGRATQNPVVYLRVPAAAIRAGVEESPARTTPAEPALTVLPSIGLDRFLIQYLAPTAAEVRILDCTGRLVRAWPVAPTCNSHSSLLTTHYSLHWDRTDASGRRVTSGLYFCVLTDQTGRMTIRKLNVI